MTKPITKEEVIKRLAFGCKVPRNWQKDYDMRIWRNVKTQDYIKDLDVFIYASDYHCQTCGVTTADIRHITIDCFYELKEVSPKFVMTKQYFEDKEHWKWVYTILVCKGCRSLFMFDYLAHFVDNAKRLREEKGIDDDGIMMVNLLGN